jgi:hypothetical protein
MLYMYSLYTLIPFPHSGPLFARSSLAHSRNLPFRGRRIINRLLRMLQLDVFRLCSRGGNGSFRRCAVAACLAVAVQMETEEDEGYCEEDACRLSASFIQASRRRAWGRRGDDGGGEEKEKETRGERKPYNSSPPNPQAAANAFLYVYTLSRFPSTPRFLAHKS